MITALQQSFLEARTALPSVMSFNADIIVISVGADRGQWSRYHVFSSGETLHFVFFKEAGADRWVCADIELQQWLEDNNAIALHVLSSCSK